MGVLYQLHTAQPLHLTKLGLTSVHRFYENLFTSFYTHPPTKYTIIQYNPAILHHSSQTSCCYTNYIGINMKCKMKTLYFINEAVHQSICLQIE